MKIKDIDKNAFLQKLEIIAEKYEPQKDEYFYKNTYPYFIDYFKNIDKIKMEHFIIGLSFTYSWMPTIPSNSNFSNGDEVTKILNKAKLGEVLLSEYELGKLQIACNNSLIGVSKLLHFINSHKYAIWDRKVTKFLNNGNIFYKYNAENYLAYLLFLNELKNEPMFKNIFEPMKQKVGNISEYRALELIFFNANKYEGK
ncbi:hypothetical protein [Paenimyroides viscosum]|uniref:Uncharacterized protein n=1 Tax=Paenimyroides viscosum TaxID=2488729 RepID=A0A3P1B1F5_9FLAO|nr:hypothetical protein [Paenimyroides viscosum]RRA94884.1 hypothetical protein EG242_07640 [Paenimyroides viscosum]